MGNVNQLFDFLIQQHHTVPDTIYAVFRPPLLILLVLEVCQGVFCKYNKIQFMLKYLYVDRTHSVVSLVTPPLWRPRVLLLEAGKGSRSDERPL